MRLNAWSGHATILIKKKFFIRIAIATGARMSAILGLRWSDVTWPRGAPPETDEAGQLFEDYMDEPRMGGPLILDLGTGSGNKRRGTGVIGPGHIDLLRGLSLAHRRAKSHYIIEYKGKGIKTIELSTAYEKAGLGHKKAENHILKHTCCTWLVQAGVPLERIEKLVGTSSKIIEQHYGHHDPRHLATAADILNV